MRISHNNNEANCKSGSQVVSKAEGGLCSKQCKEFQSSIHQLMSTEAVVGIFVF